MRIIRREAHPTDGPGFELQTFTCSKCSHTQQISVETPGALGGEAKR
jgi:hypothetical protein